MDPTFEPAGENQGPSPMWPQAGVPGSTGVPPGLGFPPNQPSASQRDHRRGIVLASAIVGAVLIISVVLIFYVFSKPATTENVRVITPPPAAAGGLHQDLAVENKASWKAGVASLRSRYASFFHLSPQGSAIALYTNSPGGVADPAAYAYVLYMGFNVPGHDDTAPSIGAAIRGFASHITGASTVAVNGGPGDTAYSCVTGSDPNGPATACGWATDRTIGVLLRIGGGTDPQARALIALMQKMRPDLVRG